jgi:nitrate reductase gamma subunit
MTTTLHALTLALILFVFAFSAVSAQDPTGNASAGSCWQCHRQPNVEGTNGVAAANALCQDCHTKADTVRRVNGKEVSLQIRAADFGNTWHAQVACISCHNTVARSPHREVGAVTCGDTACHNDLAKHIAAGDAHLNVDCAACHFQYDTLARDATTNRVMIARADASARPIGRTNHALAVPVPCERCHTRGNPVRAAAAVLPGKDITCIGCHASAPVIASPLSWGALIIFFVGLAFSASVWLSGNIAGKTGLTLGEKLSYIAARKVEIIFSRRIFAVLRTAFVDGILHWRILKESVSRWVAHSLILLPFFARFLLAIFTWLAVLFSPDAPLTRLLVDRDAPVIAFTNDFLAILVIIGAGYAGYLRATDKQRRELTAGQDTLALILLALIFVVGFVLEAAHILVAQIPWERAWYAFGGAAIAAPLSLLSLDWSAIYPFVFYAHAILVALFVAYLPFSKFFHILVSLFFVAVRPAIEQQKEH